MKEKISSFHLWQKIVSLLTLGLVAILLFVLIYILIRPLEKPRPIFSRLPDQRYLTPFEGFEMEMITLLEKHHQLFRKYEELFLVFPSGGLFPGEIVSVFLNFCEIHQMPFHQKETLVSDDVKKGVAFVILEDTVLAEFVELTTEKDLVIGQDAGVVSYGDSPLKRIVANGITVIENRVENCVPPEGRSKKAPLKHCLSFIERKSL